MTPERALEIAGQQLGQCTASLAAAVVVQGVFADRAATANLLDDAAIAAENAATHFRTAAHILRHPTRAS